MIYQLTNTTEILRVADGATIPADPANIDYQSYQAWIAVGNTPIPIDLPDPKIAIQEKIAILEQSITSRRLREAMLTQDYSFIKSVNDQIAALRAEL